RLRLLVGQVFRVPVVPPEAAGDEQQRGGAEQEAALTLQAGLAEQAFEGAVGHSSTMLRAECQIAHTKHGALSLLLASRTKVRRAPRKPHLHDGRAAAAAGLAGAGVGAELVLVIAALAVAVDERADRRAVAVDGPRQHRDDGAAQAV